MAQFSTLGHRTPSASDQPGWSRSEMVARGVEHLRDVGSSLRLHADDLPIEVRRNRHIGGSFLLRALNIYLHHRLLDSFLSKHRSCRSHVCFIFGSRYPYLQAEEFDVRVEHGNSGEAAPMPTSQTEAHGEWTWVPDVEAVVVESSSQSRLLKMAVDAFNGFEPAARHCKSRRPAGTKWLTADELHTLEGELYEKDMNGTATLSSTELKLHLKTATAMHSMDDTDEPATADFSVPEGAAGVSMMDQHWDLSLPGNDCDAKHAKRQLKIAQDFLSLDDIDRTPGWRRKFDELADYVCRLKSRCRSKDLDSDLAQVVLMMRTHRLFDEDLCSWPETLPDVSDQQRPKHPKIPETTTGSSAAVEAFPESGILADVRVKCVDDGCNRRPVSMLVEHYLSRYRKDARVFWAEKPTGETLNAEKDVQVNMVQHESEAYEICMDQGVVYTAERMAAVTKSNTAIERDGGQQTSHEEQLRSFATLRGTKRAALQQLLGLLGTSESQPATTTNQGRSVGPADGVAGLGELSIPRTAVSSAEKRGQTHLGLEPRKRARTRPSSSGCIIGGTDWQPEERGKTEASIETRMESHPSRVSHEEMKTSPPEPSSSQGASTSAEFPPATMMALAGQDEKGRGSEGRNRHLPTPSPDVDDSSTCSTGGREKPRAANPLQDFPSPATSHGAKPPSPVDDNTQSPHPPFRKDDAKPDEYDLAASSLSSAAQSGPRRTGSSKMLAWLRLRTTPMVPEPLLLRVVDPADKESILG
ncbi:hypothetical protein RJ55_08450 [Drechmeria coniospora]|nr:hypothetical protein RJ55_08450 [Drechmeria coniospora]